MPKSMGLSWINLYHFTPVGPTSSTLMASFKPSNMGAVWEAPFFPLTKHVRSFPQCLVSTARARLEKLQVLCKSGLCLHVEDEAAAPAQLQLCSDATTLKDRKQWCKAEYYRSHLQRTRSPRAWAAFFFLFWGIYTLQCKWWQVLQP